jgi:hypothetical protein
MGGTRDAASALISCPGLTPIETSPPPNARGAAFGLRMDCALGPPKLLGALVSAMQFALKRGAPGTMPEKRQRDRQSSQVVVSLHNLAIVA